MHQFAALLFDLHQCAFGDPCLLGEGVEGKTFRLAKFKQARGDLIEAIFLVRAYRTTLPRPCR